jgi:hypothetical protein
MDTLILKLNASGDVVRTTPLLRNCRAESPGDGPEESAVARRATEDSDVWPGRKGEGD